MTGPTTPRGPLQGLQDLSQLMTGKQPRMSTFLRGLVFGAFVGAAIAGSAILRRRVKGPSSDDDARRAGL
jgi:hypothetical protein